MKNPYAELRVYRKSVGNGLPPRILSTSENDAFQLSVRFNVTDETSTNASTPHARLRWAVLLQTFWPWRDGAWWSRDWLSAGLPVLVEGKGFNGRQFTSEIILWAVPWYLMFRSDTGTLS